MSHCRHLLKLGVSLKMKDLAVVIMSNTVKASSVCQILSGQLTS